MPISKIVRAVPKPVFLVFALLTLVIVKNQGSESPSDIAPDDPNKVLILPLRVHIIRGFEMENAGVTMGMWVTADDVRSQLLPEINRIWSAANIQWEIEGILEHQVPTSARNDQLIETIENSDRSTSTKVSEIRLLRDPSIELHPAFQNLVLFPFIGSTRQGFASFGDSFAGGDNAYVGVWSNKSTGDGTPPEQVSFSEPLPFDKGSMGRTCSHELGHNFTLQHPDPDTQIVFDRLMGGRRHGYDLIESEIMTARCIARGRLSKINDWLVANQPRTIEMGKIEFDLVDETCDLNFRSNPGQVYQIEFSSDLESENWQHLSQVIGASNANMTELENLSIEVQEPVEALFIRVKTFEVTSP